MSTQYYNNLYISVEGILTDPSKKNLYIIHISSRLQDNGKYLYSYTSQYKLLETTSRNNESAFMPESLEPTTEYAVINTQITKLLSKLCFDGNTKYIKVKVWKSQKKKNTFVCKKSQNMISKIMIYISNIFSSEIKKKKTFKL